MALGGAILAGGQATRMGEPKHAVRLQDGRTMLECVASALRRVCDVLAIVGLREPAHALDVRHRFPNAALIHDALANQGPLAGIEAVLATGLCDSYIICSCDMPLISPQVMEALAAPCDRDAAVLHVHGEEHWRPLPCRVHARAHRVVAQLLKDGARAVRDLHHAVDAKVIAAPASWAESMMDVNTPSDLVSADHLLASRPARHAHADVDPPEIETLRRSRLPEPPSP